MQCNKKNKCKKGGPFKDEFIFHCALPIVHYTDQLMTHQTGVGEDMHKMLLQISHMPGQSNMELVLDKLYEESCLQKKYLITIITRTIIQHHKAIATTTYLVLVGLDM